MDWTFSNYGCLQHPNFKECIKKDTGNERAYCKYCNTSFALSNREIQAVKSNTNGKRHKERCKTSSIFFKETVIKSKQENLEIVDTGGKGTSSSNQLTLDQSLATSNTLKIKCALKSVSPGYWNNFANQFFSSSSVDYRIKENQAEKIIYLN